MRWIQWLPALVMACVAGIAHAQTAGWKPSKNVEVIVQSAAGGSSDRSARVTQKILAANPAFPNVSVNNKPGGGGIVALHHLNQHAGDAHFIATLSTTVLTNHLLGLSPLSADGILGSGLCTVGKSARMETGCSTQRMGGRFHEQRANAAASGK